jgi:dTDP-4-amino-4,6-dideoxygalactose transaminase
MSFEKDSKNLDEIPMFSMERKMFIYKKQIFEAISEVIDSNSFILGEALKKFENQFCNFLDIKYCSGVANGTDSLEIGLRALNLPAGSSVMTVANAGCYSSAAINANNLQPLYVDINSYSLNVNKDMIVSAYQPDVKAIIVTHLYGNPVADIRDIVEYCHSRGIYVIEDCAQAHGASVDVQKVGTFGDISCFSFYPTKNLGAIGDGGLIATNNLDLDERIKKLRNHGWSQKYEVSIVDGRNSRLDEIQAAVLSKFLVNLDHENTMRVNFARKIIKSVDNPLIQFPVYESGANFHLLVLLTNRRQNLITHLNFNKINSALHYPILDNAQIRRDKVTYNLLKNSTEQGSKILSIPVHPYLSHNEVERIISALNSFR